MKEFKYVVQDELGLHARPAGLLVKEAAKYKSFGKSSGSFLGKFWKPLG